MRRDTRPPERTCIVTRRKGPPAGLVRFVLGPGDVVVPDIRRVLPGRGAWVSCDRDAVAAAVRRNAFSRAFRTAAKAPPDLAEATDALIAREALQRLAMANKAGLVVTGFEKVREALRSGDVAVVLAASDGAADGRGKLERLATHVAGSHKGTVAVVDVFPAGELGRTLGRERVVHGALAPGRLSELFLEQAGRLRRFRGQEDGVRVAAEAGPVASNEERQTDAFAGTRVI